jgi:histone demethylase JARID1
MSVQLEMSLFCFHRPRHSLSSLATAVKEMEEIPAYLPNGTVLKDSVQRARDWVQDVDALQVG